MMTANRANRSAALICADLCSPIRRTWWLRFGLLPGSRWRGNRRRSGRRFPRFPRGGPFALFCARELRLCHRLGSLQLVDLRQLRWGLSDRATTSQGGGGHAR